MWAVLIVLWAVIAPRAVQAQNSWPSVAVLSVEVYGEGGDVVVRMGERLLEAVGMQPMLVPESFLELRLSEALPMAGCTEASASCLLALTQSLGVSGLVLAQATPSSRHESGWLVQVRYFDAASGRDVFDVAVEVPPREPALWLGRVADSLLQGRGVVDVRADPTVTLRLDGQSVGQAPALLTALMPGRMQLEACPEGGRCRRVMLEVQAGTLHVVSVDAAGAIRVDGEVRAGPQRERAERTSEPRLESHPLPAGVWVAGGATVLATGAAVVWGLQAREDHKAFQETELRADAQAIADRGERHTRLSQVSAGVAVVGALGTTALVWRHSRRANTQATLGVVASPDGAALRFHHRW